VSFPGPATTETAPSVSAGSSLGSLEAKVQNDYLLYCLRSSMLVSSSPEQFPIRRRRPSRSPTGVLESSQHALLLFRLPKDISRGRRKRGAQFGRRQASEGRAEARTSSSARPSRVSLLPVSARHGLPGRQFSSVPKTTSFSPQSSHVDDLLRQHFQASARRASPSFTK